jgi:hypothetical protein
VTFVTQVKKTSEEAEELVTKKMEKEVFLLVLALVLVLVLVLVLACKKLTSLTHIQSLKLARKKEQDANVRKKQELLDAKEKKKGVRLWFKMF